MTGTERTCAPATELRWLALGDTWTYEVAGRLTPKDRPPDEVAGSIAVSICPDTMSDVAGALMLLFVQSFQVVHGDGSRDDLPAPPWQFCFVQNAVTKAVAIVADNMGRGGQPRIAAMPEIFYPGAWSLSTGYDNTLVFPGGALVRNSLRVVGQEWIQTPRGRYSCWKARIASESAEMGQTEGFDWWTPELGAPACFDTTSVLPDGTQMHIRATLTDCRLGSSLDAAMR
jgi:hypothetical protein